MFTFLIVKDSEAQRGERQDDIRVSGTARIPTQAVWVRSLLSHHSYLLVILCEESYIYKKKK